MGVIQPTSPRCRGRPCAGVVAHKAVKQRLIGTLRPSPPSGHGPAGWHGLIRGSGTEPARLPCPSPDQTVEEGPDNSQLDLPVFLQPVPGTPGRPLQVGRHPETFLPLSHFMAGP